MNNKLIKIKEDYHKIMRSDAYISGEIVDYFNNTGIFNFENHPNYFPRLCQVYEHEGNTFFEFSFNTRIDSKVINLFSRMGVDIRLEFVYLESDEHDSILVTFKWI